MMRRDAFRKISLAIFLVLIVGLSGFAQPPTLRPMFDHFVKARLLFELSPNDPDRLNVYLRLLAIPIADSASEFQWTSDPLLGVVAKVSDASGHPLAPVSRPNVDLLCDREVFLLPGGSRFDWYLSSYDPIPAFNPHHDYQVAIGKDLWLIPKKDLGHFSVNLQLKGWFGDKTAFDPHNPNQGILLLLNLAPMKISVTPAPSD